MNNTLKPISTLHTEHKEWLYKLSFYKEDLAIMQNRLDEIAKKNTSAELMAMVEQFQNQFSIQFEIIDLLKHDINQHESLIQKSILGNPVGSDHRKLPGHAGFEEKINQFEKSFADLRQRLFTFLAKVM